MRRQLAAKPLRPVSDSHPRARLPAAAQRERHYVFIQPFWLWPKRCHILSIWIAPSTTSGCAQEW